MSNLIQETLTRRVPQTLFVYLGVCWALIEVSAFIEERFALGRWLADTVMITLVCGLLSVVVLAWNHGKRGPDPWRRPELVFHGVVGVLIVALVGWRLAAERRELEAHDGVAEGVEADTSGDDSTGDDTTGGHRGEGGASAEVTGAAAPGEGSAAFEMAELEGKLAELPSIPAPGERRCVMVPPAVLAGTFDAEAQWLAYGVTYGVAELTSMRLGVEANVFSGHPAHIPDFNYDVSEGIPTAFVLDEADKASCAHVLFIRLDRMETGGLRAGMTLYKDGRPQRDLAFEAGADTLSDLVDASASGAIKALGLPEEPPLPAFKDTLTSRPQAYERFIQVLTTHLVWEAEGRALLDEVLVLDPTFLNAIMLRANSISLYGERQHGPEHYQLLTRALGQLHRLPPAKRWELQVYALQWMKKDDLALRVLDRQVETYPQDLEAQLERVRFIYREEGRAEEAVALLRRVLGVDPSNPDALGMMVRYARERGALDEAERAARRRINAYPRDVRAHMALATLLETSGRFEEARDVYAEIASLEPENTRHGLKLVELDERTGAFQRAGTQLEGLEKLGDPRIHSDVLDAKIGLAMAQGQPARALKFARAQQEPLPEGASEPDRIVEQLGVFKRLLAAGAEAEARRLLREASTYEARWMPGETLEMPPWPYHALTEAQVRWAYHQKDPGLLDKALAKREVYEREQKNHHVIGIDLYRAAERRLRGDCEAALGSLASLEDEFYRATGMFFMEKTTCLRELERYDEVVSLANDRIVDRPGDARAYVVLAKALDGAKKPREAREAYERALELWANAEDDYKPMLDARSALLELTARSE